MAEENASKRRERISQKLCPEMTILYGYSLYLLDHANESPALHRDAQRSVREFNSLANSFPKGSPGRCFCMEVRMAAAALARGIASRKRILNEKIRAAEQKKEDMIRRMGQKERLVGFLRAGLRLAILGGFSYAFVRAFIHLPALEGETGAEKFAAIATALAVTLLGSCIRAAIITRRMEKVFTEYDEALNVANEKYIRSVTMQYKLAAETAEMAWKEMTDEPPPMTSSFKALLMGIVAGERRKAAESERRKKRSFEELVRKLQVFGSKLPELRKKNREHSSIVSRKTGSQDHKTALKGLTPSESPR